ncbi:MAG TPA: iron ABC transporter permease [Noviherbaspirillum sp.]
MHIESLKTDPARAWIVLAIVASILLPWYAVSDDFSWTSGYLDVFRNTDNANAWVQAVMHQRPWLWMPLLALAACALALKRDRPSQGTWFIAASVCGLAGLLGFGFAVGPQGWIWPAMQSGPLALPAGQFGIGWGGLIVLVSLLMLLSIGVARKGGFRGDVFVSGAVIGCSALLLLFVAFPVLKAVAGAFFDDADHFSLSAAMVRVFHGRVWGLQCFRGGMSCGAAWNTVILGMATAAGTTLLGTLLAFLTERSFRRAKPLVGLLATLPIITPPFVVGLGLILLFGRAGLVNQVLESAFGIEPSRWFYGSQGVWLAQMFAFTPTAFLMMRGSVQVIAPTLEEAAQTLRASPMRTLLTITLPLLKPALTNTFLVGFIESMADFGNPIVVGGQFSVLSTEIFFAIVGAQLDQGRAAALALVLSAFALAVFGLQRWILGKANYTSVSGKGDSGIPAALPPLVRRAAKCIVLPWLGFTIVIYVLAFVGGFVKTWGRDYTLTLQHFRTAFDLQWGQYGIVWAGTAWNSLWTTMKLAGGTAPLTAFVGMLIAFLVARTKFKGQTTFEFSALLAFAIPGTVLGVSYILAFNVPPFELTGTGLIIVLCFMFRNLPVSIRASSAAFKQLDKSLDEASIMLGASTLTTLRRVILPLLRPALLASLIYSFVRAMTTVSAVIFLVTAENELATTYIIGRVGNGDYGVALAYCTVLIVLMLAAISLIKLVVGERKLGRRSETAGIKFPWQRSTKGARTASLQN